MSSTSLAARTFNSVPDLIRRDSGSSGSSSSTTALKVVKKKLGDDRYALRIAAPNNTSSLRSKSLSTVSPIHSLKEPDLVMADERWVKTKSPGHHEHDGACNHGTDDNDVEVIT